MRSLLIPNWTIFTAVAAASSAAFSVASFATSRTRIADAAQDDYAHACHLLERGVNYNAAIASLRTALTSDPNNGKYHLALASALVDRAASIAHAASQIDKYVEYRKHYRDDYALWKSVQDGTEPPPDDSIELKKRKDLPGMLVMLIKASERHDQMIARRSRAPSEPILRTQDDLRPFKLTEDESIKQFASLCRESMEEFKKSLAMATSPSDHADASCAEGWAKLMILKDSQLLDLNAPVDRREILASFQQALDNVDNSPVFWRAKADAILETAKRTEMPDAEESRDALFAYREALALDRRDRAHVNCRVIALLQPQLQHPLKSDSATKTALEDALRVDPNNAYLVYLQSCLSFDDAVATDPHHPLTTACGSEAIALMEAANVHGRYSPLEYDEAIPLRIAPAWRFDNDIDLAPNAWDPLAHLASIVSRHAVNLAREGEHDLAARALTAVVGMGRRLQAQQPADSDPWAEANDSLALGIRAILNSGYEGLVRYYEIQNDADGVRRSKADVLSAAKLYRDRHDDFRAAEIYGYPGE